MSAFLCPVYTQFVQCLGRTAQTRSRHSQHFAFPLLRLYTPSSVPFFELHRQNLLQRLVQQVLGVWRLGFHGSRAPLLPDCSSGGDRRESERKSLNVPISMQGRSHQGRQAALEKVVIGRGALAEWLQQAGAEGQLPLAGGYHTGHIPAVLEMTSPVSFPPCKLNAPETGKPLISYWGGTGTKIRRLKFVHLITSVIMVTLRWRSAERGSWRAT